MPKRQESVYLSYVKDEMQIGDSSGFRLRTSVVDWQGRASGKRGQDRQLQQDQREKRREFMHK